MSGIKTLYADLLHNLNTRKARKIITAMLVLISRCVETGEYCDALVVAWSTLWNITHETPQNCQSFIEKQGMEYLLACLQKFPGKEILLRVMVGLLGNLAEVADLRPQLMNEYILSFVDGFLDSFGDSIEMSYNAASIIVHMASDGAVAWILNDPARERILNRVAAAIECWDLRVRSIVNYRAFKPLLNLLHVNHTPQCQHWAVWDLAHRTTVYPERYCEMVAAEGGIQVLYELLNDPTSLTQIKKLAGIVIKNCAQYLSRKCNSSSSSKSPE